jgi:hypothetical protein
MYIKLNNNEIEKYPYSEWQLKSDNPQVSFPATISKQILEEFGVYEVVATDAPSITYKQDLSEGTPVNEDGVWKQTWVVTDKPAEEVSAIQESNRKQAYIDESDPLFFKWQRGEATEQEWIDKVNEIKQRWV